MGPTGAPAFAATALRLGKPFDAKAVAPKPNGRRRTVARGRKCNGAQRIDYRERHLSEPPRGYEWRQSNGQYVLAAITTGLIASIILSNGH